MRISKGVETITEKIPIIYFKLTLLEANLLQDYFDGLRNVGAVRLVEQLRDQLKEVTDEN